MLDVGCVIHTTPVYAMGTHAPQRLVFADN